MSFYRNMGMKVQKTTMEIIQNRPLTQDATAVKEGLASRGAGLSDPFVSQCQLHMLGGKS